MGIGGGVCSYKVVRPMSLLGYQPGMVCVLRLMVGAGGAVCRL